MGVGGTQEDEIVVPTVWERRGSQRREIAIKDDSHDNSGSVPPNMSPSQGLHPME